MNRRSFLATSGIASAVTAGALAGPAWLRDAFALNRQEAPRATDSLATLSTAFRAAERAGKPLVILVIPEDPMARWERGTLFGEYLNHAADAELAPLALAEVTCARRSTARLLLPMLPADQAKDGEGARDEPLLLLVETAAVPAAVQVIAMPAALPALPRALFGEEGDGARKQCQEKRALVARWRQELGAPADEPLLREVLGRCAEDAPPAQPGKTVPGPGDAYAQEAAREDSVVRLRIRTVARLAQRALAPDAATLRRRRDELLARLPAAAARAATLKAQSAQALAQLPAAEADQLAPLLFLRAQELGEGDARQALDLKKALAQAAAARLRAQPVSGSRWAQSNGCGTRLEDEKEDRSLMVSCGMGHVPAKSARFLYFYTGGI